MNILITVTNTKYSNSKPVNAKLALEDKGLCKITVSTRAQIGALGETISKISESLGISNIYYPKEVTSIREALHEYNESLYSLEVDGNQVTISK